MPATNPRVHVVIEEPMYDSVPRLGKRDKVSLPLKVRDLVKDALEIEEERALTVLADEREHRYDALKALSHQEIWGPLRRKRR